MSTSCRLIVDPPDDGAWNMAVDEAILSEAAETNAPTLRFYRWHQPTLSLGYFQRAADRIQHPASLKADVVRRISGGGAIVHDRELTYSIALPREHSSTTTSQLLYRTVHTVLIDYFMKCLGKENEGSPFSICETSSRREQKGEPFLCFLRRSPGDVLCFSADRGASPSQYKLVGSAQRRRRGVLLQHGSILLGRSEQAPGLPGFNELTDTELAPEDAITELSLLLCNALQLSPQPPIASRDCLVSGLQRSQQKYSGADWTYRR